MRPLPSWGLSLLTALLLLFTSPLQAQQPPSIHSPDGKLSAEFIMKGEAAYYAIRLNNSIVLQDSRLGLVRDDEDFSKGLTLASQTQPREIEDHYEILTAKRRINTYRANQQVFHLISTSGKKIDIDFQVSNDGVAFRYIFPDQSTELRKLKEEETSYHFLPGTTAWLQPMSVPKTGYANCNPAYEEYYQKGITVGTPSTYGMGWVYPALFHTGDTWLLVSEVGLERNYCATRLRHDSPDGEYSIGFPDPRETMPNGPVNPQSDLPWMTPWRIVVVGSLKTIAESTLGTDLAEKATEPLDPTIKPGKASWSWALLGDKQTTYPTQRRFIDYAADMGWSYCLIDALWDTKIGYEKMKDLADYAATKNVGIELWYNSGGNWNATRQTPKDRMLTHESRIAEFEKISAMGIKGIKVDFFAGDGQSVINYYQDILDDAKPYHLLVNFHGTTLPRGWGRTFPHLMSMEAVKAFEFTRNTQTDADEEPAHATVLPFGRNVFDPMDFTPVCLDKISERVKRRTTSAFELALSVIFTSGIQHYVEIPEGMAKMPNDVKEFMKHVPSIWDDTKFIDGFPGKLVVLARQGNGHWYVAGINGEAAEKHLTLDLSSLPGSGHGTMITDGTAGERFASHPVDFSPKKTLDLTLAPDGGFVITLE